MTEKDFNHRRKQEDMLAKIFDKVTPRPRPSQRSEDKAFEALHARWQHNLNTHRRRSFFMPAAIAASLLLVAGVVWLQLVTDNTAAPSLVADIARMTGEFATVRTHAGGEQMLGNSNRVMTDSIVTTGSATRLALTWMSGGSLRLDENSRLEVLSADHVKLLAGALYYDSKGGARIAPGNSVLVIETPTGNVRHVGTQFMVEVGDGGARIRVREGKVRFNNTQLDMVIESGRQIDVNSHGLQSQSPVASHGDAWNWVEGIAPHFQADGQPVAAVLHWIARETGRKVVYHRRAQSIARETVAHGFTTVNPDDALIALGKATDLHFEIVENRIEVGERADQ